jgi:hypothetical protein
VTASGFELKLPGERRLHIPSDFDEGALVRLLRVEVLTRLPTTLARDLDTLLPWNLPAVTAD